MGALVLFILPTLHEMTTATRFFIVIGVLLAPVLRMAARHEEKRHEKPTYNVGGWLGILRLSILALLAGISVALIRPDAFTLGVFSVAAFFTLAPEFIALTDILRFEGKRKRTTILLPLIPALLPLIAVIIVGIIFWFIMPDTAALFIALAAGTMLYAAIADGAGVALKKHNMMDAGLVILGAALSAGLALYWAYLP